MPSVKNPNEFILCSKKILFIWRIGLMFPELKYSKEKKIFQTQKNEIRQIFTTACFLAYFFFYFTLMMGGASMNPILDQMSNILLVLRVYILMFLFHKNIQTFGEILLELGLIYDELMEDGLEINFSTVELKVFTIFTVDLLVGSFLTVEQFFNSLSETMSVPYTWIDVALSNPHLFIDVESKIFLIFILCTLHHFLSDINKKLTPKISLESLIRYEDRLVSILNVCFDSFDYGILLIFSHNFYGYLYSIYIFFISINEVKWSLKLTLLMIEQIGLLTWYSLVVIPLILYHESAKKKVSFDLIAKTILYIEFRRNSKIWVF